MSVKVRQVKYLISKYSYVIYLIQNGLFERKYLSDSEFDRDTLLITTHVNLMSPQAKGKINKLIRRKSTRRGALSTYSPETDYVYFLIQLQALKKMISKKNYRSE